MKDDERTDFTVGIILSLRYLTRRLEHQRVFDENELANWLAGAASRGHNLSPAEQRGLEGMARIMGTEQPYDSPSWLQGVIDGGRSNKANDTDDDGAK